MHATLHPYVYVSEERKQEDKIRSMMEKIERKMDERTG